MSAWLSVRGLALSAKWFLTKEFGPYVYLGELIDEYRVPTDEMVGLRCGDCACGFRPTGALLGDDVWAMRRLSYRTQTKGFMPQEFRKKSGMWFMAVIFASKCVRIIREKITRNPEIIRWGDVSALARDDFEQEFGRERGKMAGSWRGKKPLQRNAINALANYR